MRKLLLSSAALVFLPQISFAQVPDTSTAELVVVSATRTPQPLARTASSISVITAAELQTQQTNVLSDVLQQTPGLTVSRNGGVGQSTTVMMRGAESGQTVVLIDGVRINDPSATDDTAVLGDLLVNNIDRVEVLRGPQSVLYGSDAIGGVIDVFTKRGGGTPFAFVGTAEGGAFDTVHLNAAANGSEDIVDYGVGLNFYDTRGTPAAFSGSEANGYINYGATGNLRIHTSETTSVDLRGYYTHAHDAFDDGFDPVTFLIGDSEANNANDLYVGYAGFNVDLFGGMFHNRLAVMATSSTRQFFDSSFDTIHLNSDDFADVLRFEYQGTINPTDADEITFGAEVEHSQFRGDSFSSFMPTDTETGRTQISGYYAEAQHTFFDQLTVIAGVRYDDADIFGTHTSTKFAGAWQVPVLGTTLRGNYADGFKAPSLFQQFSQFSNPTTNLEPETAKGWEVGADQPLFDGLLKASATYFARNTHNLIIFDSCPSPDPACATRPFGFYANLGRTRATGVETEATLSVSETLTITANYTELSALDLTTGIELPRRPHAAANAVVTWNLLPEATVGGSVTYVGSRFDQGVRLGDHTLFNLFGSYRLTDQYEAFARVENLFDDHYQPLLGYGAPGRGIFAGLRVKVD
jgi:vitamin B12 transporter